MDDRLALVIKYYQSNLDDQAWALVSELVNEPDPATDVLSMAATMAFERRDLSSAVAYCDRLLAFQNDDSHTLLIKGRALSDLGQQDQALSCLESAVAADETFAAAHYNLGWVRQAMGNRDGAIAAYRAAVARQDPYPVAWNNLGLMLEEAGDGEGAISAYRTAIRQFPEFSAAHNNLGAVYAAAGHFHAAAEAYGEALRVGPGNLDAEVNLGVAHLEQADIAGAIEHFKSVLGVDATHGAARSNALYAEIYRRDDDNALRIEHAADGNLWDIPPSSQSMLKDPDPDRTLDVGFLSPDFRRHSVSFFSLPLIESLNPNQVRSHVFNDSDVNDIITARFRAAADVCHEVSSLTDDALQDLIEAQKLDVLIDLAGRTTGNRARVLARRCAPIQIAALGYPGPSGLQAMDYWLCDPITNPASSDESFDRDLPLRLDRGLHVFDPPGDAPDVASLPALESGALTFGSFNKLAKISDATVGLWAGVLNAVPNSHLLVKARALAEAETAEALRHRFRSRDVDPDRIEIHKWAVADSDHLALYSRVDVALDTFPYNGTTTSCEALWMGVPVLTLKGQGHAARVGASLLTSAGLADWICKTPQQFAEKAQASAGDIGALAELRSGLRGQIKTSALTDGAAYARSVESALRSAWRRLCAHPR